LLVEYIHMMDVLIPNRTNVSNSCSISTVCIMVQESHESI
jgi:hypothetical protein